MLHCLRTLTALLVNLLAALLSDPPAEVPAASPACVRRRQRVAVVGTVWDAEALLGLAERHGARELEVMTLPDGSFVVRWR